MLSNQRNSPWCRQPLNPLAQLSPLPLLQQFHSPDSITLRFHICTSALTSVHQSLTPRNNTIHIQQGTASDVQLILMPSTPISHPRKPRETRRVSYNKHAPPEPLNLPHSTPSFKTPAVYENVSIRHLLSENVPTDYKNAVTATTESREHLKPHTYGTKALTSNAINRTYAG